MEVFKGMPALDAGLLAAAQAVEQHDEMSRYGTLGTWADELGMPGAAKLLKAASSPPEPPSPFIRSSTARRGESNGFGSYQTCQVPGQHRSRAGTKLVRMPPVSGVATLAGQATTKEGGKRERIGCAGKTNGGRLLLREAARAFFGASYDMDAVGGASAGTSVHGCGRC